MLEKKTFKKQLIIDALNTELAPCLYFHWMCNKRKMKITSLQRTAKEKPKKQNCNQEKAASASLKTNNMRSL